MDKLHIKVTIRSLNLLEEAIKKINEIKGKHLYNAHSVEVIIEVLS